MASAGYGWGIWVILGIYFLSLFLAGHVAWRWNRKAVSDGGGALGAHYLANRALGPVVLTLSTVASLYSGYTVVGTPAEAFTTGFLAMRWTGAVTLICLTILTYAPRLQFLSRRRGYISILDFMWDRFHSKTLHVVMVVSLVVPTAIYVLAQFASFGGTISGLSGGTIPTWAGSLFLAGLLVIYEAVGGLTAVALTDVLQGLVLLFGSCVIFVFQGTVFEGMPHIGEVLQQTQPAKTAVPASTANLGWFDFIVGVGLSIPLYPHFQSRVMAARSAGTFRGAVCCLCISPFLTLFPAALVGLVMSTRLDADTSPNSVFGLFVAEIIKKGTFTYIIGSMMLSSSVAAIMSTADSLLIALSHIITVDVINPMFSNKLPVKRLLWLGRAITASIAFGCVPIAESNINLTTLIKIQSAVMVQIAPTYVFALYTSWVRWTGAAVGVIGGIVTVVVIIVTEVTKVPTSTTGLAVNVFLLLFVSLLEHFLVKKASSPEDIAAEMAERQQDIIADDPALMKKYIGVMLTGHQLAAEREPIHKWPILVVLGIAPFFGIPFYRTSGIQDSLIGGFPLWVVTALGLWGVVYIGLIFVALVLWVPNPEADKRAASRRVISRDDVVSAALNRKIGGPLGYGALRAVQAVRTGDYRIADEMVDIDTQSLPSSSGMKTLPGGEGEQQA
eukprot:TRINITY_DN53562_c0_g1_i1.p1 TRINITY_DN53562_c0_g1~~TRINITY_DN53562_c0_g1_i1.p1  ORF type:complete len:672 (-),score=27.53 TRINITY_DN53562_c0_g1_i1:102-2117(-)